MPRPDPRPRPWRPGGATRPRRLRRVRRDESGQALIEFVLVLPVVALIMGIAFNGWNAMQLDIGLTSAARAGAIEAVNDLSANTTVQKAWDDATAAVNAEQGVSGVYQDTNPQGAAYVDLVPSTQTTSTGVTIHVVTITVSQSSATLVPLVSNLSVNAKATARY